MGMNYYGAPQYSYGYSGQMPMNPYAYGGYSGYGQGGLGSYGYNPFGNYQANPYAYNAPGSYDVGGQGGWGGQGYQSQQPSFDMQSYIKQYLTNLGYTQQQQPAAAAPTKLTDDPQTPDPTATVQLPAVPPVQQHNGTNMQVNTLKGDNYKYLSPDGMDNFGKKFQNTGEWGAKGLAGIQQMGYANPQEYLAANTGMQGLRDNYVANQAAKRAARNTNVVKGNTVDPRTVSTM